MLPPPLGCVKFCVAAPGSIRCRIRMPSPLPSLKPPFYRLLLRLVLLLEESVLLANNPWRRESGGLD